MSYVVFQLSATTVVIFIVFIAAPYVITKPQVSEILAVCVVVAVAINVADGFTSSAGTKAQLAYGMEEIVKIFGMGFGVSSRFNGNEDMGFDVAVFVIGL